jgi:hypothetical protein
MSIVNETPKRQLSIEEHQQALLFQFIALYERWSEDRQVAAKQGYDLAKQLEQFTEEVKRFSVIEEAVLVKLKKSLNETVVTLSEKVNHATADALNNTLGACVQRMDEAARKTETILAANQEIRWLRYLKTLVVNVLCSLLVSRFVVWFFMPQPTLPLTAEDMSTYLAGKKILALWSTLPKEKQQRIVAMMKVTRAKEINTSSCMEKMKP